MKFFRRRTHKQNPSIMRVRTCFYATTYTYFIRRKDFIAKSLPSSNHQLYRVFLLIFQIINTMYDITLLLLEIMSGFMHTECHATACGVEGPFSPILIQI